jgi:predicted N-acetyltransferase YhbS
MQIRLATEADFDELINFLDNSELFRDEKRGLDELKERFPRGEIDCFIAIEDGKIVGHSSINYLDQHRTVPPYEPMVYLSTMVVDPNYRKRGIAHALSDAYLSHLEQSGFQGTVAGDALTWYSTPQKTLIQAGFHPVSVRLDKQKPHIGFYRLFGLENEEAMLYVPDDLREPVKSIISPLCTIEFGERGRGTIDETCQDLYVDNPSLFDNPEMGWRLDLTSEAAAATIDFLRHHPSNPHYCAGFKPFIDGDRFGVYVHMDKLSSQQFDRDAIKVIPEAQELFDFVWDQCY